MIAIGAVTKIMIITVREFDIWESFPYMESTRKSKTGVFDNFLKYEFLKYTIKRMASVVFPVHS